MTLSQTIRPATALAALAILASRSSRLVSAPIAAGQASFDGGWSVLIVTEKGTCDRAYRYPVKIENGSVGYAGSASFNVTGKVGHERRRDRHGVARQPKRHRHRPHVGHRRLGHLDGGFRRMLRHLDRRAPLLRFLTTLHCDLLQPPDLKPGASRAFFFGA